MSLPVIVIVSSLQCGHCVNMRGTDGSLKSNDSPISIPSKWSWNENFFLNLIRGGESSGPAKFRVFEINYSVLNPNPENIKQISEFTIVNNKLKRVIYNNNNNNLEITTIVDGKNNTNPSTNTKFNEFVSKNIPSDISNFAVIFPAVLYFSNNSWENSKLNKESLYGLIGGANVKYNNGKWVFDGSVQPTRVDPVEMASKISKGQLSLNPEAIPIGNTSDKVISRTGCSAPTHYILPM
jgi:hypothetical protein